MLDRRASLEQPFLTGRHTALLGRDVGRRFSPMILRWLSAQGNGQTTASGAGLDAVTCGQAARQLPLADRLAQRGIFEHG